MRLCRDGRDFGDTYYQLTVLRALHYDEEDVVSFVEGFALFVVEHSTSRLAIWSSDRCPHPPRVLLDLCRVSVPKAIAPPTPGDGRIEGPALTCIGLSTAIVSDEYLHSCSR